jgi:hypothetical protein
VHGAKKKAILIPNIVPMQRLCGPFVEAILRSGSIGHYGVIGKKGQGLPDISGSLGTALNCTVPIIVTGRFKLESAWVDRFDG